ncbi:cyclic di-GMP phosphodiesterase Gmr [mine drainage metagenome]|uniref:Cyclic di-GMP phosphodiesterase Gmr n=1 Tax=mine drainage metagenome TaxID=410659 RepID=A0A1J5RK36_9ZZZZ
MTSPDSAQPAGPIDRSLQQTLLECRAILENASVGILFTRDRRILHCNPKFSEIFGWPQGELIGQPASVFYLSPEDYAELDRVATPILSSGGQLDREMSMRRKDGSTVHCHALAKAINPANTEEGTIWIAEDISDRKESEIRLKQLLHEKTLAQEVLARAHDELEHRVKERTAELALANARLTAEVTERKAAEQRFHSLFDLSPDPTWIIVDQRFVECNEAAARMLGYPGRSDVLFVHPSKLSPKRQPDGEPSREKANRMIGIALERGLHRFEWVHTRADGSNFWAEVTLSAITVQEQEAIYCTWRDISERKVAEQQIEFLAYHDPLTGLPNRLLLQDRFEHAMAYAERAGTRLALLFLDLDNFKNINDSLGHAIGDGLLKEVASRLAECVRETDTISRQGGDEFLVVLPDLNDTDAALPVLAKIMERLQEPFCSDVDELSTSASIGVAIFPDDGGDFETLLKKADMAMYRAKGAGRNAYRFFDETMNVEAVEHLTMRNGLRRALERGEFVLHYQPQIELAGGAVVGAEALIRWNHPELGLVPPARFIPIAEESGLIVPIGEWVLHEACRQAMAWKRAGLPELAIAVNLSAVQFKRADVEKTVIGALQSSGLDPALLELELTESILIQDVENVLATVKRLTLLGVKLSIDDFGTGYSSLSYLKRFDIDKLKIDQSFVRDLASDEDDAAIVRAIIQMARSLNLKTIAEGVEDIGILQRLRLLHCDEAQGYHIARPMPADAFAAYLAAAQETGSGLPR